MEYDFKHQNQYVKICRESVERHFILKKIADKHEITAFFFYFGIAIEIVHMSHCMGKERIVSFLAKTVHTFFRNIYLYSI